MTNVQTILERFDALNIWRRRDQRAPHKPLLVLYALGRWQAGQAVLPFPQVEVALATLLERFGPSRKTHDVRDPFWRLQRDGVWIVNLPLGSKGQGRVEPPTLGTLRSAGVYGEFSSDVQAALATHAEIAGQIAARLLGCHFPPTLHPAILAAVEFDAAEIVIDRSLGLVARRDRQVQTEFRLRMLRAYDERCAFCGLDLRLGGQPVALEAAHIFWHKHGGPSVESNGLALCALHHGLFDFGAFTINDGLVIVSPQADGTTGFAATLADHHGRPIRSPQQPEWRPEPKHLEWHGREVFKSEAKHLA